MNLRDAIRQINTIEQVYSLTGTVTGIDADNRTCTVKPVNGDAEIFDVRLQAVIGNDSGVVVFPASGSVVLVTMLNPHAGFISLCSDVDRVEITCPRVDLGGPDGEAIPKGEALNDSLMAITDNIIDLANHLVTFSSTQASASSGVLLPLAPGFTSLSGLASAVVAAATVLKQTYAGHLSTKTFTE